MRRRVGLESRREERGSGTVLVTAALGVLLVVILAGVQVASAAVAAHRARAAADLAALAGATALQQGTADPCSRASDLATRNGARLTSCRMETAESLRVRVAKDVPGRWPGVPRVATASARAGPAPMRAP
ncbi:Rv3654c family TadE-like protein [Knoellia sp. LjRoot47]|uniref:Rv3654c family TadE-like protein n=1 Tax=Knoellia sp. LjRoot47 TaxID=3342330 RepID=UPI003ECF6496